MNRFLRILALSTLGLGGLISWGSSTGFLNPGAEPELDALPKHFAGLTSVHTFEVDSGLLGDLPPDRFTFQELEDEEGHLGKLYIAYYRRGRRWSGRPHELTICYRAIGYEQESGEHLTLADGAIIRRSRFIRDGEEIVVYHWLQRPGMSPGHDGAGDYLRRMASLDGLRQDVASVYLEFPAADAPSEFALLEAAQAVQDELSAVWKIPATPQDS